MHDIAVFGTEESVCADILAALEMPEVMGFAVAMEPKPVRECVKNQVAAVSPMLDFDVSDMAAAASVNIETAHPTRAPMDSASGILSSRGSSKRHKSIKANPCRHKQSLHSQHIKMRRTSSTLPKDTQRVSFFQAHRMDICSRAFGHLREAEAAGA
ncbi:hypothetical protein LEN26_005345 [Aphanomyces euteiches]|nr:hypothetical protein LEN26_005345 [Aphanomyces euteiches]